MSNNVFKIGTHWEHGYLNCGPCDFLRDDCVIRRQVIREEFGEKYKCPGPLCHGSGVYKISLIKIAE